MFGAKAVILSPHVSPADMREAVVDAATAAEIPGALVHTSLNG